MRLIATCKLGLESLVAAELRRIEIEPESVADARVTFPGDFSTMARACLWLRTAERVLAEVGTFEARTFEELFEGVKALPWKQYLARDAFIHVNGKSAKSTLFSVSDCQSITKKAIVENLRAAYHTQTLPETGKEVIVEVGILKDVVTLALDPCGAGLSRRGYRTFNVAAPISETLGAAIVLLSRYAPEQPLIDPMCGSGTMPIEAAMIAENRAPGLNRPFAAEEWPFLPERVFALAREEARDAVTPQKLDILGYRRAFHRPVQKACEESGDHGKLGGAPRARACQQQNGRCARLQSALWRAHVQKERGGAPVPGDAYGVRRPFRLAEEHHHCICGF